MSKRTVTLEDKYQLEQGSVFMTGIQALVRLPLEQKRLDRAAGLNTAGFISGYRGSPLGGYDQQLKRAQKWLDSHDVRLWEGLNEDLGATAVWGSQQVGLFDGARFDGVFGLWYGKAPGVDRTGDVFKHANFAGTARHGGVLAIAGDDHACKSSTLPSQSEFAFRDAEIPVLHPAGVQEVLDFGLLGLAMSRYSGCWVGMIALADTMDSGAVVRLDPARRQFAIPTDFQMPASGPHIRRDDKPMDKEARLRLVKLPAALAFARANALNRVALASARPRFGIVASGQALFDVLEALDCLGLSPQRAAEHGLAIYKVGMPWPLEPAGVAAFARGLEQVLVVEHKRDLIEAQLKDALYSLPDGQRPRILGKRDEAGARLLSEIAALPVPTIAKAIYDRLPEEARTPEAAVYFARAQRALDQAAALETDLYRKPHYCSGCPHNTSTIVPDGSRALAGIGCHYMATFMGRADMTSQMGGEGMAWIGQQPFTNERHVFVNLGDGTYAHSGSLAIRAAVTAKINATYKLLYNGAVAMTGGQDVETGTSVRDIVRQLKAEGVAKIVVVADDFERHNHYELGAELYDRSHLEEVQRNLREIAGVTVIIYDQVCATERRRKVKRGLAKPATKRVFINSDVCEGCGDCSIKSNCLSVEPFETAIGTKRRINQSTCNQDTRCVDGFCPSFVTLEGATNALRQRPPIAVDAEGLPEPILPALARAYSLVFTGVGGTGVTTVSAILGMAAHVDGLAATTLDMTGLAQKGGAVKAHIRIAATPEDIRSGRTPTGAADAVIAGDLIVAAGAEALELMDSLSTRAVANLDVTPTAEFIADRSRRFESAPLRRRLEKAVAQLDAINAEALAEEILFDQLYANMILLGFAWGKGLVPVSLQALQEAIRLNGAFVEENTKAFDVGRIAALAPERLPQIAPRRAPAAQTLDELIAHRTALLTQYQDPAYALRYRALVDRVRAREAELGLGEQLTRAAAANFAKLMAYKDEYEVARLYADGRWEKALRETFAGDLKIRFHLAPPLIAGKDPRTGHLNKRAFGPWMLWVFKGLSKLKALRGTRYDPFGWTAERRAERGLRDAYERGMDRVLQSLSPATYDLAIQIAALPDRIRGFGHVKEASVAAAREAEAQLWAAHEAARSAPPIKAAAE